MCIRDRARRCDNSLDDPYKIGFGGKRAEYETKAAGRWRRRADLARKPRSAEFGDTGPATTKSPRVGDGRQSSTFHPVPTRLGTGREPGLPPRAAGSGLFLSHFETVLRDTPKIRVSPRREERS